MSDIIGKEIIVVGTDIYPSIKEKGQKASTIQFKMSTGDEEKDMQGENYLVKTGSQVLLNQIKKCKEKEPYITTIELKKTANDKTYYTFT